MPRTVTFAARANAAGEWLLVANALQRRAPVVSESPEPVLAGHEEQVDANGRRWVADHLRAKRLAWSSRPMSATGSSARRARYPAMAHDPDDRLETAGSAFRFTRLPTSVTNLESSGDRLSFLQTRANGNDSLRSATFNIATPSGHRQRAGSMTKPTPMP